MYNIGRPSRSNPFKILHPEEHLLACGNVQQKFELYIFPVSLSILTSSGGIRSGLKSRRHSIVALMRFWASAGCHFDARMYLGIVSGLSSHLSSHEWYESVSGSAIVPAY